MDERAGAAQAGEYALRHGVRDVIVLGRHDDKEQHFSAVLHGVRRPLPRARCLAQCSLGPLPIGADELNDARAAEEDAANDDDAHGVDGGGGHGDHGDGGEEPEGAPALDKTLVQALSSTAAGQTKLAALTARRDRLVAERRVRALSRSQPGLQAAFEDADTAQSDAAEAVKALQERLERMKKRKRELEGCTDVQPRPPTHETPTITDANLRQRSVRRRPPCSGD